jgi:hypothetical protein
MRLEKKQKDIPTKFYILEQKKGKVYMSNGILNPNFTDLYLNKNEILTTTIDEEVKRLRALGYRFV